ncbi:S-adenosylmethionine synthetase [Helicobacter heilmannii ASB1.4]|nr:S-adenosylmethionine synthetase [Helicobacter heilmannii ASB1.4]
MGIDTIVVSTQHSPEIDQKHLREAVIEEVVYKVLPKEFLNNNIKYHINPTGKFVIGGPQGDAGLTGRKIIVDTYGGSCPHGGGAFSGKDPSKVDRSAAYMARYIAKNLVASGVCKRATVQLAYAIGIVDPVSVYIDAQHTSIHSPQALEACVRALFKLTPKGIIESLGLLRPIYRKTATYGHFGREEFSWEKTDKATAIADFLSK